MSDPSTQKDTASVETAPLETGGRLSAFVRFLPFVTRLRGWAGGHWSRSVMIGVAILSVIGTTIVAWAYLARLAIHSGQVPLKYALDAMDQGQTEQARALVSRMLTGGHLPHSEYGGPLFVLGAIKTYDAELDATPEKRRVDYLVASRYLKEVRDFGFPPGRENVGNFLLGKSLLESNQFDEGISLLNDILAADGASESPMAWGIHRLLASACLWMADPKLDESLHHSENALESPNLKPDERADVLIDRAHCLARLGRFDDARKAVNAIPAEADRRAYMLLTRAQITLDEVEDNVNKSASQERAGVVAKAAPALSEALHGLDEAVTLAKEDLSVLRRAAYLRGRGLKLQGDSTAAVRQFSQVRQIYSDSPEGLAASLWEAELLRLQGDYPAALLGYRRVLEGMTSPASYRSVVLPLTNVREQTLAALADFRDRERFADALAMLTRFSPLFSRSEELKFRGELLEHWGEMLLVQSPNEESDEPNPTRAEALRHLREAGMAYEQLADLHFSSEAYTADLWKSAEDFYRGHSFSRAIDLLNKFLKNEPERQNAQALLRLGQSNLALGQIPQSIAALEECIEFHPLDSATYQARIDCAKAYWYRGDVDNAERLLRDNIAGSVLKPASREWKDSLFELGMLLYEKGQYEQAIDTLEEAIGRYKHDPQTLLAKYVVGESYRNSAEDLLQRVRTARTSAERDKSDELAKLRLNTALERFTDVQVNITLEAQDNHRDPMRGAMLCNCYMLAGTVLFDLERYNDAIYAYSKVSSLYPNDPFVLETFVQIANCWRRLDRLDKARGAIQQAQNVFERLPPDADFASSTALNRDEWRLLLSDMVKW